jgi:hypothetical protein
LIGMGNPCLIFSLVNSSSYPLDCLFSHCYWIKENLHDIL